MQCRVIKHFKTLVTVRPAKRIHPRLARMFAAECHLSVGRGLMLWLLTGVYLLDFFCYGAGIQFYVILSPYLCLISFLYLGLYVLVDDAWIS